jgi:hypothetical protein
MVSEPLPSLRWWERAQAQWGTPAGTLGPKRGWLWRPTSPGNEDVLICINAPFMTQRVLKPWWSWTYQNSAVKRAAARAIPGWVTSWEVWYGEPKADSIVSLGVGHYRTTPNLTSSIPSFYILYKIQNGIKVTVFLVVLIIPILLFIQVFSFKGFFGIFHCESNIPNASLRIALHLTKIRSLFGSSRATYNICYRLLQSKYEIKIMFSRYKSINLMKASTPTDVSCAVMRHSILHAPSTILVVPPRASLTTSSTCLLSDSVYISGSTRRHGLFSGPFHD